MIRSGEGFVEIETIKVGDRVATGSASNETAVDPQTDRLVTLRIKGLGDDVFEIKCLRPLQWVNENHIEPGAKVQFVVSEMGIDGVADVFAVTSCPTIAKGSGRVVLMTVTHLNPAVMRLTLAGLSAPLEPTASHRLFSADRNDWVQAQELRAGERLKTATGSVELLAIAQKPGVHRVYNFEVEIEHRYLVSSIQVISHNACNAGQSAPLSQQQQSAVRKINNAVDDHMAPKDISGAVADQSGMDIPNIKTGGVWDHTKEVGDAMRGITKKMEIIKDSTDPAAVAAMQKAEEALKRARDALKGAGI